MALFNSVSYFVSVLEFVFISPLDFCHGSVFQLHWCLGGIILLVMIDVFLCEVSGGFSATGF